LWWGRFSVNEQIQRENNKMSSTTLSCGLAVRLEAKPGSEEKLETLLRKGLEMVHEENINPLWIAVRLGPTTFGIFDAFPNDDGRQQHLAGPVAQALIENAPDLLAKPMSIEPFDVIGGKITNAVFEEAVPKAA
jgi:quinol monooxygenase YgiN